MFPAENLWLCITVPAFIVASLVFIKLAQQRISKQTENQLRRAQIQNRKLPISKPVVSEEYSSSMRNGQQAERKRDNQDKPQNCQKYLGYLYMRQASEKTHIPTECYDCRKLLQCMYSPNVIERVYGQ
jgi:hypothetical protein